MSHDQNFKNLILDYTHRMPGHPRSPGGGPATHWPSARTGAQKARVE
jgi:hypothetical protein